MSLDDITLAVDYFDLKKIAESGQCFRWKELGPGKYLIPSGQTCAIMEQKEPDDGLHLLIEEGTLPLWQDYLNYGERYGSIIREAREATLADGSPDLFLREAVLEAAGVQILTQDLWETLVSFVISQNNNIARIRGIVERLCALAGEPVAYGRFSFHDPARQAGFSLQELAPLRAGWRTACFWSVWAGGRPFPGMCGSTGPWIPSSPGASRSAAAARPALPSSTSLPMPGLICPGAAKKGKRKSRIDFIPPGRYTIGVEKEKGKDPPHGRLFCCPDEYDYF